MSQLTHERAELLRTAVLALGIQSALALLYLALTSAGLTAPTMLAIPFVWVTAAVVAVRHVERPAASRDTRWVGTVFGTVYALGLVWLTGMVSPAMGAATGVNIVLLAPGWGPVIRYSGTVLSFVLVPYQIVGFVALGYLVSLAVRDIVHNGLSAGVGGVLALGSCASCALPVVAALGGLLGGVGLGAVPAVGGGTYLLGTAAFVLAVAVLTRRPTLHR